MARAKSRSEKQVMAAAICDKFAPRNSIPLSNIRAADVDIMPAMMAGAKREFTSTTLRISDDIKNTIIGTTIK